MKQDFHTSNWDGWIAIAIGAVGAVALLLIDSVQQV